MSCHGGCQPLRGHGGGSGGGVVARVWAPHLGRGHLMGLCAEHAAGVGGVLAAENLFAGHRRHRRQRGQGVGAPGR